MTTNYAGNSASYPANVRLPADGDLRNATILAAATTDLADRTANLNSRTTAVTAGVPGVAPYYVREFGFTGNNRGHNIGGRWTWFDVNQSSVFTTRSHWFHSDTTVASDEYLLIEVTDLIPYVGRISRFALYLQGGPSHSALPGNMPRIALFRNDAELTRNTRPSAISDWFADNSATVAEYQTAHALGFSPATPIQISTHSQYWIGIIGEGGQNNQPLTAITGGYLEFAP